MEYSGKAASISKTCNITNGHVLLLPFPGQGHIKTFMKLSHLLAEQGIRVTIPISNFIYTRIISEFKNLENAELQDRVALVSAPDGLEAEEDCKDERKIAESINRVMPGYVEELIKEANNQTGYDGKVTCLISDVPFGWAPEIAGKMGIKCAMLFSSAPGILALTVKLPEFTESGSIGTDGSATRPQKIEVTPYLPALTTAEFPWNFPGNPSMQKLIFTTFSAICQNMKASDWILCNWFHKLDPSISDLVPNMLSIGPLITDPQKPSGNFWKEDLTCLNWLDQHPPGSVIYIAFGSSWVVSQNQIHELAHGLELSNRPFLWVIRPDLHPDDTYPEGFISRTSKIGKIVGWAPQEAVLAHPSIACFVSHCGWNSTIEGISMGVPMLCWPSFADQFYNKTCVCEGWRIGLWLKPGKDEGFIDRFEISKKIDELVGDEAIRKNVKKMKGLAEKSASEGGSSWRNLREFVDQIKGC